MQSIPLIDVAAARAGTPGARDAAAMAMRDACRNIGFFYVRGHGVAAAQCAQLLAASRAAFALPDAAKAQASARHWPCRRGFEPLATQILDEGTPADLKESFYVGRDLPMDHPYVRAGLPNYGPNQWPAGVPGFRPAVEAYFDAMRALERELYRLLARSLDLPEDTFEPTLIESAAMLRLLHYPPHPADAPQAQLGAGAHTDWGGLTILLQDATGGLEVRNRDGEWLRAEPIEGAFVVNLGEMISRWTNGLYESMLHRVRNPGGDRYSAAFFSNPDHYARIECLPTCTDAEHPPKYPPCTAGEHIEAMYQLTYGRVAAA